MKHRCRIRPFACSCGVGCALDRPAQEEQSEHHAYRLHLAPAVGSMRRNFDLKSTTGMPLIEGETVLTPAATPVLTSNLETSASPTSATLLPVPVFTRDWLRSSELIT